MKNHQIKTIVIICLSIIIIGLVTTIIILTNPIQESSFASCLTEKGAIFYGSESCGYCSKQKELFGEDFKYINYVSCLQDRESCIEAEIQAFPTWIIDGKKVVGLQSLESLSKLSGCEI